MDINLLPRKRCKKRAATDAYILAHKGIDAAILADTLDISERFVVMRQRKLGLRLCLNTPRKGGNHVHGTVRQEV